VDIGGLICGRFCQHQVTEMSYRQLSQDAPAFSLKDLCDAYGFCRETIYKQIRQGKLRAVKVGRRTIFLRPDVDAWAASLPGIGPKQPSA
jgi:excisionase family DNA binding protein